LDQSSWKEISAAAAIYDEPGYVAQSRDYI